MTGLYIAFLVQHKNEKVQDADLRSGCPSLSDPPRDQESAPAMVNESNFWKPSLIRMQRM